MEKTENKHSNLVSLMQAYLLSIGGLNQIMGIFLDKTDGIMVMNLIPVAGLIFLHFFTSSKKKDLNMDRKALLFVYYIFSVIAIYKYAFRYTTYTYTYALVYCFIPIYLSFYKVNVEKILKYMMFFSILVLPVSGEFFKTGGFYYETIGMSTTYNVLPFVVAAILHFWYYRGEKGLFKWFGYIVNFYYLSKIIIYGNRGPMISLVVLGLFIILHKFNEDGRMKKNALKTVIITAIAAFTVIYVIDNIADVLRAVNDWLNSMGIKMSALTKSIYKLEQGDLSNGRDWIYDFTKEGIKEHYLVGNGISTIYYNSFYRIPYPHNLFLQMWYDLGVVVSLPLFYLVVKSAFVTAVKQGLKKDYSVMMMVLFTLSIPKLCYSAEFWVNIPFWLLIMYTISPNIYGEEYETENIEETEEKGLDYDTI